MSAVPNPVRVSVSEYLATSYRPDCDYVDGEVQERNWGDKNHSILQGSLIALFFLKRQPWQVEVYPELRVQVSPTHFRVPDLTVTRMGLQWERILRTPPLLFIEILSPEDTLHRVRERVDDYLRFGTQNIWVLDPDSRRAYVCTKTSFHEPEDGILAVPDSQIKVVLSEIFAELDRV